MDNETPQPTEPASNNQQPINQSPAPSAGFGNGMRVIQPLDPNLKVDTTPSQPPTQPASATPPNPSQEPTNTGMQPADTTTQPRANPSSIYPEATQGMSATSYQTPSPADNKKDTNESYNFSNGYSIGGSIFWLQLLAGIVLGLILFGIDSSVLKTASIAVIGIVSLLYYLVEFFVVAYIPYNTLKSNNVDEPFWLTTFGVAVQAIIIATLFELVISLIIRSVIQHGVPSSLTHIGGAGLGGIAIVVYVGFFIASYFLTKLSWGIAFSLFGKIKNKTIVKAIGIGVIAIIVGGIAYHYLTLNRPKTNLSESQALATSNNSSNFVHYNVDEASPPFSVDFYKDSVINRVAGQFILENIKPYGAYITVSTDSQPAPTSCLGGQPFTFDSQGNKGLGCYQQGGTDGYIQVGGQNYTIALLNSNGVSLQANESIFNSIVIN